MENHSWQRCNRGVIYGVRAESTVKGVKGNFLMDSLWKTAHRKGLSSSYWMDLGPLAPTRWAVGTLTSSVVYNLVESCFLCSLFFPLSLDFYYISTYHNIWPEPSNLLAINSLSWVGLITCCCHLLAICGTAHLFCNNHYIDGGNVLKWNFQLMPPCKTPLWPE